MNIGDSETNQGQPIKLSYEQLLDPVWFSAVRWIAWSQLTLSVAAEMACILYFMVNTDLRMLMYTSVGEATIYACVNGLSVTAAILLLRQHRIGRIGSIISSLLSLCVTAFSIFKYASLYDGLFTRTTHLEWIFFYLVPITWQLPWMVIPVLSIALLSRQDIRQYFRNH